jgi:hypothetical protein
MIDAKTSALVANTASAPAPLVAVRVLRAFYADAVVHPVGTTVLLAHPLAAMVITANKAELAPEPEPEPLRPAPEHELDEVAAPVETKPAKGKK